MLTPGIIGHGHTQTAFAGPIKETFHLSGDIELVAPAVSDVHAELAFAQAEAIDHLDRIIPAYQDRGSWSSGVEAVQYVFHPNGDDAVKTAHNFIGITEIGPPAPAI